MILALQRTDYFRRVVLCKIIINKQHNDKLTFNKGLRYDESELYVHGHRYTISRYWLSENLYYHIPLDGETYLTLIHNDIIPTV